MFLSSAHERPRPLHRLTPLGDDPVASWLRSAPVISMAALGVLLWSLYLFFWLGAIVLVPLALGLFGLLLRRVIWFFAALTGAGLLPAMRRTLVRVRNDRLQKLVRRAAGAEAVQIDDWSALEHEPDGRALSVVGWIRARAELAARVGGRPAVGVALGCVQTYPGVLESVHDFDLVDDEGRSIPIRVAGGRVLGPSNTRVFRDTEGRFLVGSLDLPAGAVSTGEALVLRDGDAVMVIGFKTTIVDPSQAGIRQAPVRVGLASSEPRPLLVYAIAGQRRPRVPTTGA